MLPSRLGIFLSLRLRLLGRCLRLSLCLYEFFEFLMLYEALRLVGFAFEAALTDQSRHLAATKDGRGVLNRAMRSALCPDHFYLGA